ncbi:Iron(III) dicitrate transport protein FecA [Nonlabens marinus S1-08]|uniref:Iron(III) dicitrate transport protein FecA n=1 Tax=Nonlabens marinus S1-08 TaxID=1454201 RepID=W8VXC4_9FLAO|nr:Iron(III) dicitrate transport protein FecA [Nonlabens marinus S1-08]
MGFVAFAQTQIKGKITEAASGLPVIQASIYEKDRALLSTTDVQGNYSFTTNKNEISLVIYAPNYEVIELTVNITGATQLDFQLAPLTETLNAVQINARKEQIFKLKRLKDVEGTAIYAGKKTEVVLLENSTANLATNNARQIYNQVAGLNIFQNDDAGLQLNIGGRGLDPNRTANFNTRQNGYDISADVLGYPESYYSPAAEGLKEIQIIRGAASLQYGTQFGGLINFVMKEPVKDKPLEILTRNTLGSNNLYTNFTSASGTAGKWSYYTFFNYKKGDGFRPNSQFESKNVYSHIGYTFNEKTKITGELTYLRYLAQQAGGLTDVQFNNDPFQSNRERNWFKVDWLLYNLRLDHKFSENTNFSFSAFGLDASRKSVGFRSNRVSQVDPGGPRDLIVGDFNNYGFETRLVSEYTIADRDATFLIGSKYYRARNYSRQGPGSDGSGPDFEFRNDEFPNFPTQNEFDYPNRNLSFFGENILYLNEKLSVTPGVRFEYIKTESDGYFQRINTDAAGNVILNQRIEEETVNERSFVLLGLGSSYKPSNSLEFYGNISQNYRSVTFNDISTVNPAFQIDPNITDERGFTTDLGARGNYQDYFSYDVNVFGLSYEDRIGFIIQESPDGNIKVLRTNVGDAFLYGLESLVDFNLRKVLLNNNKDYNFNFFVNTSYIRSEYTRSDENGVEGKEVEFVPELNFKTGITAGYKNFLASLQYSYLSRQFTDATNSTEANQSGVIGAIPSYDILDFSASYKYKNYKLEAGINNVLNNSYFTRRATGYPGPGIIPSQDRNYYVTLEIRI